jgi:hypothetical protein
MVNALPWQISSCYQAGRDDMPINGFLVHILLMKKQRQWKSPDPLWEFSHRKIWTWGFWLHWLHGWVWCSSRVKTSAMFHLMCSRTRKTKAQAVCLCSHLREYQRNSTQGLEHLEEMVFKWASKFHLNDLAKINLATPPLGYQRQEENENNTP